MSTVFLYIPPEVGPWDDPDTGRVYKPGLPAFDTTDADQLAAVNRAIAAGAGFNVSELVSALIQIAWANITGKPSTFTPSAHTHAASEIVSGILDAARVPGLDASKLVTGVLSALRIPDLDAAKIATGVLGTGRIPNLDAAKIISGVLDLARIPDLPASKITSGEFDPARIPTIAWAKVDPASRPTTLAGYGITDAMTALEIASAIQTAINGVLDGAPAALDTLNELAAAIGDDADAIGTLTAAIALKLDASLWIAATASNDGYMSAAQAAKLDGIETGATADQTPAEIEAAYEGRPDTNKFTDAEKTKLGGIAANATANQSDAHLLDRANHTGEQPTSSVTGLDAALAARPLTSDLPFASIAQYSSTDTATDLAAGAVISWNDPVSTDSAITIGGVNNTEITVAEDGKYRVAARLSYEDTSADGVDVDNAIGVTITVNGVGVGRQGPGSPVVNANGQNEGAAYIEEVLTLTTGDVVRVTTQRLAGGDELYLRSGESALIVERVGGKSPLLAAQGISDISGLQDALDARASLVGGKVPLSELPDAVVGGLQYQGTWNAATNTPTLASGTGTKGHYYRIATEGSTEIDGVSDWAGGDWIVFNGVIWEKVDNSERVTSVAGKTGAVTLEIADVGGLPAALAGKADASALAAKADLVDGQVPPGQLPDIGGGLTVGAIRTAAFTPTIGQIDPADTSGGAIVLDGLPASPQVGDEWAVIARDFSWSVSNPLTVPASEAVPVNGEPYDLIVDYPALVTGRWAGGNYGWDVTIIALDAFEPLQEAHVNAPSLLTPTDGATNVGETPTLTTGALSLSSAAAGQSHLSTDWQIATDAAFTNVVTESLDDTSNLTSWTVAAQTLSPNTQYYFRARHKTASLTSPWSPTVTATTIPVFHAPESLAVFNAFTTPPTAARKDLIDAFVRDVLPFWSKIKWLFVIGADSQASTVNWKTATAELFLVNGPTFTADREFKGNGTNARITLPGRLGNYVTGGAYTIAQFTRTAPTTGTGQFYLRDGSAYAALYSDVLNNRTSAQTLNGFAAHSGFLSGFYAYTLDTANGSKPLRLFQGASEVGFDSTASSNLPGWSNAYWLAAQNGFNGGVLDHSDAGVSFLCLADNLTDAELTDLYNAWNTYATALGV